MVPQACTFPFCGESLLVDPKSKQRTIGLATTWLICIKLLESWLPIPSAALMLHPLDIAILHERDELYECELCSLKPYYRALST